MVREAAALMGKLFINRPERKAIFKPDFQGSWHWSAFDESFKMGDFREHLTGQHCLGTYLLGLDSTVKFFAYDLDLAKATKYLPCFTLEEVDAYDIANKCEDGITIEATDGNLEAALHAPADPAHRWACIMVQSWLQLLKKHVKESLGLDSLPVVSGGGGHLFVPLPEPMPAIEARSAAIEILLTIPGVTKVNDIFNKVGPFNELSIEVFPKQDTLDGKDYGNLLRLPFGWHYEAGIRTYSIDPDAVGAAWTLNKVSSIKALRALAASTGAA